MNILKTVSKSFGGSLRNPLSGHGNRMEYDEMLLKLWLCLLTVCDFPSSVVSGQITLSNKHLSLFNYSSIASECSLSDLSPIPDTLKMSSVELPGLLSVKYKCKDSYMLIGDNENICLKGKWILPLSYHPKCVKYCSQLPFHDITLNGKCDLDGETISCHDLIKPTAIAHISCAFGYRKPNVGFVDVLRCSVKGEWEIPVYRCEQICGLEEHVSTASTSPATVPWHVGIFHKSRDWFNRSFRRKCGGTMVSAKIVISAAHCFVESFTNKTNWYDPSDFKVIAGNYSRNRVFNPHLDYEFDPESILFSSTLTLTTQILNVAQIIHSDYMGRLGYFADNFALLVLVESIIFTPTIQPVCLEVDDNSSTTSVDSGMIGKMAAWNTNNDLMLIDVTTSGRDDCLLMFNASTKYIGTEKFCVVNGNVCEFEQGTGLVLSKTIGGKTFYFLRGISSTTAECDEDTLFTDVLFYTDIISKHLNETRYGNGSMNELNDNSQMYPTAEELSVVEGSCLIPADLPETIQVYYAAQPDREIPKGSYVDPFVDVIYKCNEKYAIVGRGTGNFCLNGKWEDPNHPECIQLCPALNLSGVTTSATCEIDGASVSCNQPLRPNTIARLTCAIGYRKSSDNFYDVLRCGDDGEWDYQPFRCEPICGIEAPEARTYIIGGEISNITKAPWHVGIFSDICKEGQFSQICGGTILNAKVVISAAHCFWDSIENQFHNESNFKVAAGKYYRDFYATEPIESQILNVRHIYHKSEYSDYAGLYAFDIVLLIVEDYIVFKSYIKPICLETLFYNEKNVAPGLIGRVAGWGLESSAGKSSAVLKIIDLPAIEYHECKEKFSPEFRPFITPDKFCAGFTDGQSVCEGDSGGGLAFPKMIGGTSVYYLRGIVSAGDNKAGSCDNEKYTIFTNIQYHIEMITFIESTNRPK